MLNITVLAQGITTGILLGGVYALLGVGLQLVVGVAGIVNFAQASIMTLGMYLTYQIGTWLGINAYLMIILIFPIFFILGLLIQRFLITPVIEMPEYTSLMITMGLLLIIENGCLFVWGPDPVVFPVESLNKVLSILGVTISLQRLICLIAAAALAAAIFLFLQKTDLGLSIKAATQDKLGARVVGINLTRVYLVCFGISTLCAGVAGALIIPFLYATPYVGGVYLLKVFVVIVLGGMGSISGVIFSSFIVGIADSLGGIYFPGTSGDMAIFAVFIGILLLRPKGLLAR
jgi:branched-chain amino acid transport system permease protein